jgi:DNA-binding Lrp family transcriptional regulator
MGVSRKSEKGGINAHEVIPLDELDKKILRVLQEDGKASLRQIADKIKSNVSTVKNHYDALIEKSVIKKTSAMIDCCKIGYQDMLIFYIRVNNSVPIDQIINQLTITRPVIQYAEDGKEIDESERWSEEKRLLSKINFLYMVSGSFPIMGMAKCLSKESQIYLLEAIKKIPGVEEITTEVVLRRLKEDPQLEIP